MEYCRECHLVLPLSCGRQVLPCPPPLPVDPAKDIVIHCTVCKKTWSMPVSKVVKGKGPMLKSCPTSECKAVLIHPKVEFAKYRDEPATTHLAVKSTSAKATKAKKNAAAPEEGE